MEDGQDLYFCKLVHNGYVQESFYRRGNSVNEIIRSLHLFEWVRGTWGVSRVSEGDKNA